MPGNTEHCIMSDQSLCDMRDTKDSTTQLKKIVLLLLVSCFGCRGSNAPDDLYPMEFLQQDEKDGKLVPFDLDGDGKDEAVAVRENTRTELSDVLIYSNDLTTLGQANFSGLIAGDAFFQDYDNDEIMEVLVPHVVDDSLFVTVVSRTGEKLKKIFLTGGKDRIDPDGTTYDWDPSVLEMEVVESTDGKGRRLLSVLNTGYAMLPRGVLLHSWPEGRKLDEEIIGNAIGKGKVVIADIDGDGKTEVAVTGAASRNGANAGGMGDDVNRLVIFELDIGLEIERVFPLGTENASLIYGGPNGLAKNLLVLVLYSEFSPARGTRIFLVESEPWRLRLSDQGSINQRFKRPLFFEFERGSNPRIVFAKEPNEIWEYDLTTNSSSKSTVGHDLDYIVKTGDLDGDSQEELFTVSNSSSTLYWQDSDLEPRATIFGSSLSIFNRGVGQESYLAVFNESRDRTTFHIAHSTPWYLMRKYSTTGGVILFIVLFLFTANLAAVARKKGRKYEIATRRNKEALALSDSLAINNRDLLNKIRELENRLKELEEFASLSSDAREHLQESLTVTDELANSLGAETQDDKSAESFSNVLQIETDLGIKDPDFNSSMLAERLVMGTRSLERKIKLLRGVTPGQYIKLRRISRAKQVLSEDTSKLVKEVAYEVGYRNQNHFSAVFRQECGMTPTEWRLNSAIEKPNL